MEIKMQRDKAQLFAKLSRDIGDTLVIEAMEKVPRELFVPEISRHLSYKDIALPIGLGQTISQPFVVALMTTLLDLKSTDSVLEVGTGSGYQAAVLSGLLTAGNVVTVEKLPSLASQARSLIMSLGSHNVDVYIAGQTLGYRQRAPYSGIIVTAGSPSIPKSLVDQLELDGRMIIPIGDRDEQQIVKIMKSRDGVRTENMGSCRFVPLLGVEAWDEETARD